MFTALLSREKIMPLRSNRWVLSLDLRQHPWGTGPLHMLTSIDLLKGLHEHGSARPICHLGILGIQLVSAELACRDRLVVVGRGTCKDLVIADPAKPILELGRLVSDKRSGPRHHSGGINRGTGDVSGRPKRPPSSWIAAAGF